MAGPHIDLAPQGKSGIYQADGFGKDAVCPFTGEKGENSSRATYTYDQNKGTFCVSALRRDYSHGNDREAVYPDPNKPLKVATYAEAVALATVTDAVLSATLKGMNPNAEAFTDVPIQNSNALKCILEGAVENAKSAMTPPKSALEDVCGFFKGVVATKDITPDDVKEAKEGQSNRQSREAGADHLDGTTRLTSKEDPSMAVYCKTANDKIYVWEPTETSRLDEGQWTKFEDTPSGRNDALDCISASLNVADTMKIGLQARKAAENCGVTLALDSTHGTPSSHSSAQQPAMQNKGLSL